MSCKNVVNVVQNCNCGNCGTCGVKGRKKVIKIKGRRKKPVAKKKIIKIKAKRVLNKGKKALKNLKKTKDIKKDIKALQKGVEAEIEDKETVRKLREVRNTDLALKRKALEAQQETLNLRNLQEAKFITKLIAQGTTSTSVQVPKPPTPLPPAIGSKKSDTDTEPETDSSSSENEVVALKKKLKEQIDKLNIEIVKNTAEKEPLLKIKARDRDLKQKKSLVFLNNRLVTNRRKLRNLSAELVDLQDDESTDLPQRPPEPAPIIEPDRPQNIEPPAVLQLREGISKDFKTAQEIESAMARLIDVIKTLKPNERKESDRLLVEYKQQLAILRENIQSKQRRLINALKNPSTNPTRRPSLAEDEKSGDGKMGIERGLMTSEIDRIMSPYSAYQGCFPSDKIQEVKPTKNKPFCWVQNTDPASKNGKHWQAVFIDPVKSKSCEFYDSYGDEPSVDTLKRINTIIDKMNLPYYLKMKTNNVVHQFNNSNTCGLLATMFLIKRLQGMNFQEATGFKMDDKRQQFEKQAEQFGEKYDKKFGYI